MKNILLLMVVASFALVACEDEGPLERAGEEVDEGIEDIRAGGETIGNKIDDAADEVRNKAEEAKEELEGN